MLLNAMLLVMRKANENVRHKKTTASNNIHNTQKVTQQKVIAREEADAQNIIA